MITSLINRKASIEKNGNVYMQVKNVGEYIIE